MTKIKKNLLWILQLIIFTSIFLVLSPEPSYTLPSRFTGKIVKQVDFISLKRLDDGSFEFIQEMRSVNEKDLQAVCLTEKGYPLDPNVIAEDINALVEEGEFLDVRVEVSEYDDGVKVRFFCEERPVIEEVIFQGVEDMPDADLTDSVLLSSGDMLRDDLVLKSLQMLKDKYISEGFFNVVITYEVQPTEKKDDNKVKLVFKIDEGEEIRVERINLLGTHKINDSYLREVMETKEDSIFQDGKFNRASYELDKQKILMWYRQEGYLDADIISDSVSYEWVDDDKKDKRGIYITIKIHEGEKYYFDKYTIEGNEIIPSDVLFEKFELRHLEQTPLTRGFKKVAGFFGYYIDDETVCNDTLFQKDRYMIAFEYGTRGYLFTRVIPKKNITEREVVINGKTEKRKYVHYHLTIVEGTQAYVENIIIKGNDKTKDKVIRRELTFKEGELYDAAKIQQSRELLFKLGFFSEVNIDIRPGSSNDKVNLIVSVTEQSTGTLSLGGSYSSRYGFSIFATVGEKNLLGGAYSLEAKLEYGPVRTSFSLTYIDPWLFDYPVSFSASIFYALDTINTTSVFSSSEQANYQKQSVGYSLGLGYRPITYYTVGGVWRHTFKEILNPSGNASEEVMRLEAIGMQEKRQITFYGAFDNTDSLLNPTKGFDNYIGWTMTGGMLLWGDDHYTKFSPKTSWYYSPFTLPYLKNWPCVIQLRANANFLLPPVGENTVRNNQSMDQNPWLETEDMLYMGGPETLRGWDYYGDKDMPLSWQYRLFHSVMYGAEFRIPVHPQFLWWAFFFDAGALYTDDYWENNVEWSDTIRDDERSKKVVDVQDIASVSPLSYFKYSYGFGIRLQVPMLPMRFWFARKAVWRGISNGGLDTISDYKFQLQLGDIRY